MKDERVILREVTDALTIVRRLLDRRDYLEREMLAVDFELRAAWRAVPHMPVRSMMQIELEARHEAMLKKASHNDPDVARILKGLMDA